MSEEVSFSRLLEGGYWWSFSRLLEGGHWWSLYLGMLRKGLQLKLLPC